MELTFEVTLYDGVDEPDPGKPTPDISDIELGVRSRLEGQGFPSIEVTAVQL